MSIQEIKLEMQGLDKRTKRYKELRNILNYGKSIIDFEESDYKVSDEIYNIIKGFNGRVPSDRVKWLFKTYNKLFKQRLTQCLCPGKIKKMVIKTIKTYEKERR
jgi:hypothetical protein